MNKAIKETREKVASSLLESIDDFVNNDQYDYQTDQLDFLEVGFRPDIAYIVYQILIYSFIYYQFHP